MARATLETIAASVEELHRSRTSFHDKVQRDIEGFGRTMADHIAEDRKVAQEIRDAQLSLVKSIESVRANLETNTLATVRVDQAVFGDDKDPKDFGLRGDVDRICRIGKVIAALLAVIAAAAASQIIQALSGSFHFGQVAP